MIAAYPLQWPTGWRRISAERRKAAQFTAQSYGAPRRALTVSDGVERVLLELARMGVERQDVVISTNVRTRLDGLPRAGEPKPDDPGAAVYWEERKGERRVMAIDRYTEVADNLAAIAATLDAMRAIERHGGAVVLERAFTGFTALPPPASWRDVLGIPASAPVSPEMIAARYRIAASRVHPDKGGTHEAMSELNRARDEALKECGQ